MNVGKIPRSSRRAFNCAASRRVRGTTGATGPGVAEALREAGFAGPILALGGASAEVSDAMGKPFRLAEFLARLRRLLDAARAVDERSIPIGSFVFRPAARQLIGPAPDAVARLTDVTTP